MTAHSELVKFSSEFPTVELSADFNAQLLQRLEQSARPEPAGHVNFWLKSYWVLATALSVMVLFRIELPPVPANRWLVLFSLLAILSFALLAFLPARHAKKIAGLFGLTANQ